MNRSLCVLALSCLLAFYVTRSIKAQSSAPLPDVIRVESDEVLVPVLVIDKLKAEALNREKPGSPRIAPMLRDLAVTGLVDSDFYIFEDGRQQKVEKVTFGLHDVRDVSGSFGEKLGIRDGLWLFARPTSSELKAETMQLGAQPTENYSERKIDNLGRSVPSAYLIAYVPAHSSSGPCHDLLVKVNRPNSLVYALKGYCAERGSEYPLFGTALAHALSRRLASTETGRIPVSVNAVALISETGNVPVQVSMDVPPQSLMLIGKDCANIESPRNNMQILGIVQTTEPESASQFGDILAPGISFLGAYIPTLLPDATACGTGEVFNYQRQIYLRPGQYKLRAIFAVGEKSFGRSEISFTVDAPDDRHLQLSGIALTKLYAEAPKSSGETLAGMYIPLVSRGVEYLPAAKLNFKRADPFFFYVEVRGPSPSEGSKTGVQVRLRIVDARTGAIIRNLAPLNAADFAIPGNPIIPIGSGIHIDDLPPGNYQLQAQATTVPAPSTSGSLPLSAPPLPQTTPWHSVSFSIQ